MPSVHINTNYYKFFLYPILFLFLAYSLCNFVYIYISVSFSYFLFLLLLLISIFPTLPAIDCGPAPVLDNGNVTTTQNGTLEGFTVIYFCNSKYAFTVDSSKKRTCKSSGEWSTEIIECGECGKRSVSFQILHIIIHVAS